MLVRLEDGTWGNDVDESAAGIRRNRDMAIDDHMIAAHRYSMVSSWKPEQSWRTGGRR
jgi:hypothetical protein